MKNFVIVVQSITLLLLSSCFLVPPAHPPVSERDWCENWHPDKEVRCYKDYENGHFWSDCYYCEFDKDTNCQKCEE